jgi:dipeptide/tripeptide permease
MASQTTTEPVVAPPRRQRTFLGHPLGLYVLFFTEMWERFSYYGMLALLHLYMVNYLLFAQRDASIVIKWYTSLVYFTPLIGGFLADRYLGNKWAVVIGATGMAIGHFLMAFEQLEIFFLALVCLVIGNGFFKPNMATQVGRLYLPNDPRRDGAYTIFYMGVNLGAFLAPLACGWLAENTVGRYHSGFTLAGIGMVTGLLIYLFGLPLIVERVSGGRGGKLPAIPPEDLPAAFQAALRDLQKQTTQAKSDAFVAMVRLEELPPGLDIRKAGYAEDEVWYDHDTHTLIATRRLNALDVQVLFNAAYPDLAATGPPIPAEPRGNPPLSEQAAEQAPSVMPFLNRLAPAALVLIGIAVLLAAPVLAPGSIEMNLGLTTFASRWIGCGVIAWNTAVGLMIAGVCALVAARVLSAVHGAARDRVIVIPVLGLFVVFFWAGFQQANNALNLWADKTTDRYLTQPAPIPPLFASTETTDEPAPSAETVSEPKGFWDRWLTLFQRLPRPQAESTKDEGLAAWWTGLWNPTPTAWFLSINALAIIVLAPPMAALWTWLARRNWSPATPTKMALGVLLMGLAFVFMVGAAQHEDKPTSVAYAGPLPTGIEVNEQGQLCTVEDGHVEPFHAGRLTWDAASGTLHLQGVLPDTERDRMVRATAPAYFVVAAQQLREASAINRGQYGSVQLSRIPDGFDLRYAGLGNRVQFDPASRTLRVVNFEMADKDVKALLLAAGDREFRTAAFQLWQESAAYRVSAWWLFWFYLLATVGELCLSPVGLSMVSKLSPARFATMLMGLWMLTSFFANFVAGAFGERWGTVAPLPYFTIFVVALCGAALVLFALGRPVTRMMHGVN